MKKSELNPDPDLTLPTIPVICDQCRASGMAGDEAFSGIPDILSFEPVPRRARADGWSPQHQRAFIAALAITGSPARAARSIGKHAFGAESLRKARGGRSFAEAWEAAMDLARERELSRLHGNLAELNEKTEAAYAQASSPSPWMGVGRGEGDDDDDEAGAREYDEAMGGIRQRLLNARRLYLAGISGSAEHRAAWELLVEPVDWEKAERFAAQDDEPAGMPSMRGPDMLIPAADGWLAEITGGRDKTAEVEKALAEARQSKPPSGGEGDSPRTSIRGERGEGVSSSQSAGAHFGPDHPEPKAEVEDQ